LLNHGPEDAGWINPLPPVSNPPVQMGTGGAASEADMADQLSSTDPLPLSQQRRLQMVIDVLVSPGANQNTNPAGVIQNLFHHLTGPPAEHG